MIPVPVSKDKLLERALKFQTPLLGTSDTPTISHDSGTKTVKIGSIHHEIPKSKQIQSRKVRRLLKHAKATNGKGGEKALIGQSTCLEKDYFRLTSDPDPSTIRPESILRRALPHVLRVYKQGEKDYSWFCSQIKAIRQDMHIQRIRNAFTVRVYEVHCDVAIDESDLAELQQCLARLVQLYDSAECDLVSFEAKYGVEYTASEVLDDEKRFAGLPETDRLLLATIKRMLTESEMFRAYAIVLDASLRRTGGGAGLRVAAPGPGFIVGNKTSAAPFGDITASSSESEIAQSIMSQVQESSRLALSAGLSQASANQLKPIALASAIKQTWVSSNYVHFFRCYRAAWPKLRKLLALTSLEAWRLKATTSLFAAYRPTVPAAWFAIQIALDVGRGCDGVGAEDENDCISGSSSLTELPARELFKRLQTFLDQFGVNVEPVPSLASSIEQLIQSRQGNGSSMTKEEKLELRKIVSEKQCDLNFYLINVRESVGTFSAWQVEHNRTIQVAQTSILRRDQGILAFSESSDFEAQKRKANPSSVSPINNTENEYSLNLTAVESKGNTSRRKKKVKSKK